MRLEEKRGCRDNDYENGIYHTAEKYRCDDVKAEDAMERLREVLDDGFGYFSSPM